MNLGEGVFCHKIKIFEAEENTVPSGLKFEQNNFEL
jgi:hypothetical protein